MNHFYHFRDSDEYRAISKFYGDRRAERSQVLLINHIHEGAAIIEALEHSLPSGERFSTYEATCAYYLHPLFQNDEELTTFGKRYACGFLGGEKEPSANTVMLAMEYRARANDWLSDKIITTGHADGHFGPVYTKNGEPNAGVIPEVRAMLIADKVQNYKDFLKYHKDTHARSAELDMYFTTWLNHLGITFTHFQLLVNRAEETLS